MFLVVLIYGIIDKFQTLELWHLLCLWRHGTPWCADRPTPLGSSGENVGGANKKSILFGLGGLVIGLIIFPPFGLFLGLFLGVLIGELVQMKDHAQALKAASYSFLGVIGGMILSTILAIAFFITFIVILF